MNGTGLSVDGNCRFIIAGPASEVNDTRGFIGGRDGNRTGRRPIARIGTDDVAECCGSGFAVAVGAVYRTVNPVDVVGAGGVSVSFNHFAGSLAIPCSPGSVRFSDLHIDGVDTPGHVAGKIGRAHV